jgi:hypothetical protein
MSLIIDSPGHKLSETYWYEKGNISKKNGFILHDISKALEEMGRYLDIAETNTPMARIVDASSVFTSHAAPTPEALVELLLGRVVTLINSDGWQKGRTITVSANYDSVTKPFRKYTFDGVNVLKTEDGVVLVSALTSLNSTSAIQIKKEGAITEPSAEVLPSLAEAVRYIKSLPAALPIQFGYSHGGSVVSPGMYPGGVITGPAVWTTGGDTWTTTGTYTTNMQNAFSSGSNMRATNFIGGVLADTPTNNFHLRQEAEGTAPAWSFTASVSTTDSSPGDITFHRGYDWSE